MLNVTSPFLARLETFDHKSSGALSCMPHLLPAIKVFSANLNVLKKLLDSLSLSPFTFFASLGQP